MEKSDGTFFAPGDFVVGDNVSFYGRTFHIVDADVFTRQTMAEAGLEYGPAETYPDDPFTTKSLSTQRHGFGQSSIYLSLSSTTKATTIVGVIVAACAMLTSQQPVFLQQPTVFLHILRQR